MTKHNEIIVRTVCHFYSPSRAPVSQELLTASFKLEVSQKKFLRNYIGMVYNNTDLPWLRKLVIYPADGFALKPPRF